MTITKGKNCIRFLNLESITQLYWNLFLLAVESELCSDAAFKIWRTKCKKYTDSYKLEPGCKHIGINSVLSRLNYINILFWHWNEYILQNGNVKIVPWSSHLLYKLWQSVVKNAVGGNLICQISSIFWTGYGSSDHISNERTSSFVVTQRLHCEFGGMYPHSVLHENKILVYSFMVETTKRKQKNLGICTL